MKFSAIFVASVALLAVFSPSVASSNSISISIGSAKGHCAVSNYGLFAGVDGGVAANIAFDLNPGLPFLGFIQDILSVNQVLKDVFPSTSVFNIVSKTDSQVKVSVVTQLSVPLPKGFSVIKTQSLIGANIAIGFTLDASVSISASMVSPVLSVESAGSVRLLKLEGGAFYRVIGSSFSEGRISAYLNDGSLAQGTYIFATVA
eukprot:TRINITY_DN13257_c0_g1_i1.p1 TRINITY_DN13257_c0_g1~~TRINITY_DN13257_c0_g1_i1.p1  ORF type:complete len:203 (-),score=53.43 TRINITY_DN13257_c0_g1_i1:86-694(-)